MPILLFLPLGENTLNHMTMLGSVAENLAYGLGKNDKW